MRYFFLLLFVNLFFVSRAQSLLTLDEAVKLALQNNYDIQIAKNESVIAGNNNTAGNAGMLPSLTAGAGASGSNTNLNQNLADGRVIKRSGVAGTTLNASANLNWTLFDGMGMFINQQRLKLLEQSGEQSLRVQVENTLYQVILQYTQLIRQQYLIKVGENNLKVSAEKMRLAENRYKVGAGAKLDYLQTRVEYNNDRSALVRLTYELDAAKIQLNQLIARDPVIIYTVEDSIKSSNTLVFDQLQKDIQTKNVLLQQRDLGRQLSLLDMKSIKAQQAPRIGLDLGYNYNRNKTTAGFLLLNQNQGVTYGLNASVPLFSGFTLQRQYQNAKLLSKNVELLYSKQSSQLQSALRSVYLRYTKNAELLGIESENIETARLAASIAMDKYRIGTATLLEVKNAQQNLLNAENNYITVQFEMKVAELDLLQLSGNLIKGN